MKTENREIERLKKAQKSFGSKRYFIILIAILTVLYVVDELTSNIRYSLQTYTICDLFNTTFNSVEYASAQATLGLVTTGAYLFFLISPFYKSLADKYGRRIFLIINTIGMGIGMLVSIISHSIVFYVVGCVIMTFFTPNDMQVLYIMECAPKKHRAKLCSVTKGIALISVSLLGIFIKLFTSYDNPSTWRTVYIIPIVIAFVVGILAIFFVKETPVFTEARLAYLQMSDEEKRKKEEEKAAEKKSEISVFAAFKYIFKNTQTRFITIVAVIFAFATGYTGMFEPMLSAGVESGVMSIENKETFLIFYPYFNGLFTLLGGFIIDRLGRKKSSLILGAWTVIGLALFVVGTTVGLNVYLTAVGYGLSIAGLWSISDMLYFIITSESTPTDKRGAVVGCMQLVGMVGTGFNMVFNAFSAMIFGSTKLAMGLSMVYLPVMAVALLILMLRVKETRNVDLNHIDTDVIA